MKTSQLPLFPLLQPLFPGTRLNLQIFEQRYLRMITECLKADSTFGVVPILEGGEVGATPRVHPWGATARIIDWNQLKNGLLGIAIEGEQRFHLLNSSIDSDGLVIGKVQFCPDEDILPLDKDSEDLQDLLATLAKEFYPENTEWQPPEDSNALGWQLAQLLPVEPVLPMSLLEVNDPLLRLKHIRDWLDAITQGQST